MRISLCIPMYNENKIIAQTARSAYDYMSENFGDDFEVIFSNDGSVDGCEKTVMDMGLPNVRVVGYADNAGKGRAVREAILASNGDIVIFTDADLAYGLDVIEEAVKLFETSKCDMLIGSRPLHKDGYAGYTFVRKFASKTYVKLLGLVGSFKLSDAQCGFKVLNGDVARKIFSYCETDGFAFDLEAILIAMKINVEIAEMPVKIINHRESKVHIMSDSFKMLNDVRKMKKRIKKLVIK